MWMCDGAKVCELVCAFLIDKTSQRYDKNSTGLFREDGLLVFNYKSDTTLEKTEDNFLGLKILAESNLRTVNYLGVTLNLNNGLCIPYHKPDGIIQYISKYSNHPPKLIKDLPGSIEKESLNHSSNEKLFVEAA